MGNKITGYLFISIGVLLILFALIGLYKIFVGGAAAMTIVQLADMNVKTQYGIMQIPLNQINPILNISLFAMFMMCVISAGGQLAKIGNGMLKSERIHDALLKLNIEQATSKEAAKKL